MVSLSWIFEFKNEKNDQFCEKSTTKIHDRKSMTENSPKNFKGTEFAEEIVSELNLHHFDHVGKELELIVHNPESINESVSSKGLISYHRKRKFHVFL